MADWKMHPAIGPRTYLVGRILSALLARHEAREDNEAIFAEQAVRLADLTLNAMAHSDGKPHIGEG